MNPMKMMKQLQQLQERQEQIQKEVGEMRVTASAGGEMVTVTLSGNKELLAIRIDPEVVNRDDVAMLQDLIVAAAAEGSRKVDAAVADKMSALTAGLKLPF